MAKKNIRKEEIIDLIQSEGGTTAKTNAEIAAAIESVGDGYSGIIRVSEILRDLEDDGVIDIVRRRRHPINNPSGRTISMVVQAAAPF